MCIRDRVCTVSDAGLYCEWHRFVLWVTQVCSCEWRRFVLWVTQVCTVSDTGLYCEWHRFVLWVMQVFTCEWHRFIQWVTQVCTVSDAGFYYKWHRFVHDDSLHNQPELWCRWGTSSYPPLASPTQDLSPSRTSNRRLKCMCSQHHGGHLSPFYHTAAW